MGGYLATVTDSNEQSAVENLLYQSNLEYIKYWLGEYLGNNAEGRTVTMLEWNNRLKTWDIKQTEHCGFICEWDYTRNSSAYSADIFNDTNFTDATDFDTIVNVGVNEGLTENFHKPTNFENLGQADSLNSIIAYSNG